MWLSPTRYWRYSSIPLIEGSIQEDPSGARLLATHNFCLGSFQPEAARWRPTKM